MRHATRKQQQVWPVGLSGRAPRRAATGIAAVAAVGLAGVALALWGAGDTVEAAPVSVGAVSFDAFGETPQYSTDGAPVTVTLPGSQVARVLNPAETSPVIWQFTAEGYAQGIAGISYDVTLGAQVAPGGPVTDLTDGMGQPGTVLAASTVTVYPASVNGDCSAVPEVPEAEQGKNVFLVDNVGHVLQAPGAYQGHAVQQVWCVAMRFNQEPDGTYVNQVEATGTDTTGAVHSAIDLWHAVLPPALDWLGLYRNRADVTGTAEDGTTAHDSDLFETALIPDGSVEPDITIVLDPTVTNLNPSVLAGDHFTPPAPSQP
jgi:hypothetical protein